MTTYTLQELLDFFSKQKEIKFKVMFAVVDIMNEPTLPMSFRIDTCVELMRQHGLSSIEARTSYEPNSNPTPLEEFHVKQFSEEFVFWEVLN